MAAIPTYFREMKSKASLLSRYLPYLKNKYLLTTIGAIIWLGFFDRNDFITTWTYSQKLQALRKEKLYYEEEIKKNKDGLNDLMTNRNTLEKYAREKYYMKKDNEEIFVLIQPQEKLKSEDDEEN
jgi:cell division protein FtsB